MKTSECLIVAGIAQRQLLVLNRQTRKERGTFPNGPDDLNVPQEIAVCESIIAMMRGLLAGSLLELSFTSDGRAIAKAPDALSGTEYDNGTFREPRARRKGSP